MAAFKFDFSYSFSSDCSILTCTDISNWNSNDQNVNLTSDVVRTFELRDIFGNLIETKNIVSGNSVQFTLPLQSLAFAYLQIGLFANGTNLGYGTAKGLPLPCLL